MRKIVINQRYGGFGLSPQGEAEFCRRSGDVEMPWDISRDDPNLVQMVEQDVARYAGSGTRLAVVEIPDDVLWHVEEYDGIEWVAENHRTWRG